jgi:hypothetical protein
LAGGSAGAEPLTTTGSTPEKPGVATSSPQEARGLAQDIHVGGHATALW